MPNPFIVPLERHGSLPAVVRCGSPTEGLAQPAQLLTAFCGLGNHSLGIICKTQRQAETVARTLEAPDVHLLIQESATFKEGVIIATAHLARELEFDEV